MTDTIEDIDLDWVVFTDEDEPVVCVQAYMGVPCPNQAVGKLYLPRCGAHPLCQQCYDKYAKWKGKRRSKSCYIACEIHKTKGDYDHDPSIWVRFS